MENGFDNQFTPKQEQDSRSFPLEPYGDSGYTPGPTAPDENDGDLKTARKRFSRLGMGIFLILITAIVAMVVVMVVLEFVLPDWMSYPWGVWLVNFLPQYLVAFPVGILLLRKVPASAPEQASLSVGQCFSAVAISFFMMYFGNTVGGYVAEFVQRALGLTVDNPVEELVLGSAMIPRILFPVILAPIMEEYVFRKALIDRMRPYGSRLAVVVSAVLFGLFHGNLSQLFYATALGLVFGYIYQRTGKLRYTIGLHMLINFTGSVVASLFLENIPNLEELDFTNLEALGPVIPWAMGFMVYSLALLGLVVTGLVLLCVKARKLSFAPAEKPLPKGKRFTTVFLNAGMILLFLGCLAEIIISLTA